MARGKTTPPETVYAVMASYAVTGNYSQTARDLKIPVKTVEKLVKDNWEKEEFTKLRKEKRGEFADKCSDIIDELLEAVRRKALSYRDDEVLAAVRITEITTAIGTLYDKRALAMGESTANESMRIEVSYE